MKPTHRLNLLWVEDILQRHYTFRAYPKELIINPIDQFNKRVLKVEAEHLS